MEIKKAFVDKKLCDVVDIEEYYRRKDFNDPDMLRLTVVEHNGTLYPVVKGGMNQLPSSKPVAVVCDAAYKFVGDSNQFPEYGSDKIIDFTDVKNNTELLEKQKRLMEDENAIMNANNSDYFVPVIRDEDSPALKLVKSALKKKQINLDNYKSRFTSTCEFSNTIRLLQKPNQHTISVPKLQLIGDKFDLKFTLTVEDASDSVPNKMNESMEVEL